MAALTTLTEARDAMVAFFVSNGVPTVADVEAVFRYDPSETGELYTTPAITVSSAGMGPTVFRVLVRVYTSAASGAEIAQDSLDAITMAVDRAVDSRFGDSEWRIRFVDDAALYRAECLYECGRED